MQQKQSAILHLRSENVLIVSIWTVVNICDNMVATWDKETELIILSSKIYLQYGKIICRLWKMFWYFKNDNLS